jgi:hypothetical protein
LGFLHGALSKKKLSSWWCPMWYARCTYRLNIAKRGRWNIENSIFSFCPYIPCQGRIARKSTWHYFCILYAVLQNSIWSSITKFFFCEKVLQSWSGAGFDIKIR